MNSFAASILSTLAFALVAGGAVAADVTVIDPGLFSQVTTGDFNGDGRSDAAISLMKENKMKVYYVNTKGSFDKAFEISTGTIKPRGISVADINNDGKPDIITCDAGSSTVLVYYKTSSGSKVFTGSHKINLEGGKNCHDTTPLDINDDGWIDVIYSTQQSGEIMALLNPGTGSDSGTWTKILVAKGDELGTHQVAATMTKTGRRLWLDMIVCMDDLAARWNRVRGPVTGPVTVTKKKEFLPKKIESRAAVWVDIDEDGLEDAVICWKGEDPDACKIYKRTAGNELSTGSKTTLTFGSGGWERPMFVATKKRGDMIDLVVVYQKLTLDGQEGDGRVIVWKQSSRGSFEYLAQSVPTALDQP